MTDPNTEISIAEATTSPIYFPILTQQCQTLVLNILNARTGNLPGTDCTREQRPRLQLIFPENYTPPTAFYGDQPANGLLFQLNPRGNQGRAKCTVRLSKPITSSANIIQLTMRFHFYGTVRNLVDVVRDTFGDGNRAFRYILSNDGQFLRGGGDFWLQVLIQCHQRRFIYTMNTEQNLYFWNAFEHDWDHEQEGAFRSIRKGWFYNEGSREITVVDENNQQFNMNYEP
ncbi:hypothetical protein H4I96_03606 [Botrytis cinerea]